MPLWRRASRGQVQLQVKQTRQWRHAEYKGLQLLTTGQSQSLLEAQRIGSEKLCTKSRVVQARASGHIRDLSRISKLGNETPNPQTGAQLTNIPTETPPPSNRDGPSVPWDTPGTLDNNVMLSDYQ